MERVAEADETVGELFLMEEPVDSQTLRDGIRRATLDLKFVPVFMGRSATHDSLTALASAACYHHCRAGCQKHGMPCQPGLGAFPAV